MKKLLAGTVLLLAGLAPVIPQPMQLLYAYQTTPAAVLADATRAQTTSSSTFPTSVIAPFTDTDGNNLISVAVFKDKDGNESAIEIPDTTYTAMGKKDGQLQNPTDTDYKSALQLLALPAHAAIARDASSTASGIPNAASVTWSHTISGSNTVLVVFGYIEDGCTLSSGTFNGTGLTQVASKGPTNSRTTYSYYQIAPASGAHNIVLNGSTTCHLTGEALSYTGAKQSGQPDAHNESSHASPSTGAESISVTTVANNSWIAGFGVNDNGGTFVGSGSFTKVLNGGWAGTASYDTNAAITPAAATTVGWSGGSSPSISDSFLMAVSIAPVAAGFAPWQLYEF